MGLLTNINGQVPIISFLTRLSPRDSLPEAYFFAYHVVNSVVMIGVIKYVKPIFLSLFYLAFGLVSASTSINTERFEDKSKNPESKHYSTFTDSTSSKKKRKKSKKVIASKARMYKEQNILKRITLRKDISESARREKGNSVSTNSYAINEQFRPSTLSNIVSFNIYDKGLNVHSFSGTQSSMFRLNFTSENNVNTDRELFGFEYRFKRAETKKFGYFARARLERDNESQTYYQLGLGSRLKREKSLNLLGLEYFPVRSGPGHILDIYRTQLANYNEFQFTKKVKQILSLEGNYYTDDQADFILLSRTEYLLFESSLFRVSPLMEVAYGLGTIDRRDSYPYWMAEKRTYGGGGFALNIGSETSAFQMIADASIFGEVGQASFERYTGNLSYRVKDFTTINAGFEVYTIENFYSNVFQLGMIYNFK